MKVLLALSAAMLAVMPAVADARKKPQVSGLELQQIQSRDFESSKTIVFSAVMSVLQDNGFRIGDADKDTGFLTGTASTMEKMTWVPFIGFGSKKDTPVVSAYMEEMGPNLVRLRLNFVMARYKSNRLSGEKPITDPEIYKDAFENIQKAIFIREAMGQTKPSISQ